MKSFSLLAAAALAVSSVHSASARPLADYLAAAPFKMPAVPTPTFPDRTFPLTEYGAVGDGQTLNTEAFAKAIAACAKAGGGHVVVPAGLWLTGPIVLQSHVDLHAERGALILFTPDHTQYPMVPREGRGYVAQPCLSAVAQTDFALTGEGIYDGAGDTWRPVKKEKTTDAEWRGLLTKSTLTSGNGSIWWPTREAMEGEDYMIALDQRTKNPTAADTLPARDFRRSSMVSFQRCTNVLVDGVTLRNSPSGVFVPAHCTNVTIQHAVIFNEWSAQNGDGMDIDACHNVIIYHCNVSAGDDGICMKSGGKSPWAGEPGLMNVIVAECTVYHGHGGFVVGGATDAGMLNLWATACDFVGTDVGIRVKSGIGHGSLARNVFVDHVYMKDIVNEAILFDTFYDNTPASAATVKVAPDRDAAKTPEFRDFFIHDVFCRGAGSAIAITGLSQLPVHQITIADSVIAAKRGVRTKDAADITLRHVRVLTPESPALPQKATRNLQVID